MINMAMKSIVSCSGLRSLMEGGGRSSVSGLRYFTEGKGRILSEEERAKEIIYIQKMERERLEKAKQKAEKERAERERADKENASRIDPANPGSSVGVETL